MINLLNFLQKSKIGVVTTTYDITWQIGHPGKLFDYMSCGLPVIANNIDSWWTKMIKKEQIGLLSTDDPKDFAQLIDYLLSDEEMWNKMSNNARNLISTKFNWESNICKNLLPIFYKYGLEKNT